jgi:hypothetical protein
VETALMHADGWTLGYEEIGAICHYANQFNLLKINDHFSTGKVQASSFVDLEQHEKRHMDTVTVVPNTFCDGRTHL